MSNKAEQPAPRGPAIEANKQYAVTLTERTLTPPEFGGVWLKPGPLTLLCGETLAALLDSVEGTKVAGYEEV